MATSKKKTKDDFTIKSTDIVFSSLFYKRICIHTGEHTEFFADRELIQDVTQHMEKAKKNKIDVNIEGIKKIRIQYNSDSENKLGNWCKVSMGDFGIDFLNTKEFNKILQGFKKYLEWSGKAKAEWCGSERKISKPFIFRVK